MQSLGPHPGPRESEFALPQDPRSPVCTLGLGSIAVPGGQEINMQAPGAYREGGMLAESLATAVCSPETTQTRRASLPSLVGNTPLALL